METSSYKLNFELQRFVLNIMKEETLLQKIISRTVRITTLLVLIVTTQRRLINVRNARGFSVVEL